MQQDRVAYADALRSALGLLDDAFDPRHEIVSAARAELAGQPRVVIIGAGAIGIER